MADEVVSGSWFIFDLYTPHGGKITVKESDPAKVAEHLGNLITQVGATLLDHPGWSLVPPAALQPKAQIQERTEDGTPVITPDGVPVMIPLPAGTKVYTVAKCYHGKTQTGKDFLGVVTVEKPYDKKWGVKCFHPPFGDWKAWPVGDGEPNYFATLQGFERVVIADPEAEGKYPEVKDFRKA